MANLIIVVFSEILPVIHYEIYGNIGLVFRLIRVNAAAPVSSGFAAAYIFLAALTHILASQADKNGYGLYLNQASKTSESLIRCQLIKK